jgi:putative membrane protein
MRLTTLGVSGAALAAALALMGCDKPAANTDTAGNTMDSAANAVATSSAPVAAVEGAVSAGVGQVSAATTTTAQGFVTAAATSDMFEIAAAKIALDRSINPAVKKFAKRMIHDHSATTAAVKKILASGVAATPPTDLDERRRGLINDLNAAKPADFDKTYIDQQVAAHAEALTLFKGFIDHGDNTALKSFAADTAPKIQEHDDMAKEIQGSLK